MALVALVYGHGEAGLSRPAAIELLWGPQWSNGGRQRLRQLLLDIRTRLGAQIIETPGDRLHPHPEVESDLKVLSAALEQGSLEEAARLVISGFLISIPVVHDAFGDWRRARSEALGRDLRTHAVRRWTAATEQADWPRARDAAEALYLFSPDDPMAVEKVIEARGRVGDLVAAEEAFNRYLDCSLDRDQGAVSELGATLARLRACAEALRGASIPDDARVPFVGRRRALAKALGVMDRVQGGGFELMLVSGESGIGKTRLLDEIHREAILRGFRCLRAQSVELERSIPLNPLLDALAKVDLEPHLLALGKPWSSVIAGLLPPGTLARPPEDPPPIQASSLSRRLLDSFGLLFERLARERPTILLLDDLQWADATTIATLQFLQRRWTHGSFGVFATLRADLVRITDPVAKYLTGAGGLRVDSMELPALSTTEALDLIEAIAPHSVSGGHAQRLCAIAGHHPLYLTELTREFMAGRFALPDGPVEELDIPTSLARMLDARLEALDGRTMKVAGVLAVAARPLAVDVIAELARVSLDDAASSIEALVRSRFIEVDGHSARIAHELFRSAVYRHMNATRRALHHRAIAAHLLATAPEESAGELAIHYSRAGEDRLAARHGWLAAKRALEAGAVAEAVQFFEVVAEREADRRKQAEATGELARALYLSRDITRAIPKLSLAIERLRATGSAALGRRLEVNRLESLAEVGEASFVDLLGGLSAVKQEARNAGDWETLALALDAELHLLHRSGQVEGIPHILEQMREVGDHGERDAKLLSRAGLALGVFFTDPAEAMKAAEEAVSLSENRHPYRLLALNRLMIVLQARGMLTRTEAFPYIDEARELAERSGDLLLRFSIESNLAVAYLDAGEADRAEVLMCRARAIAGSGEMDINRFVQANNEAELALVQGDYAVAAKAFSQAAEFLGPTTPSYMRDIVNAGLGYCALETGGLTSARKYESLLQEAPAMWYFDPTTIVSFKARLLELTGRRADAIELLSRAADNLRGRLVTAWFKVSLMKIRLNAKESRGGIGQLALEMADQAQAMGLDHRAAEFRHIVSSTFQRTPNDID